MFTHTFNLGRQYLIHDPISACLRISKGVLMQNLLNGSYFDRLLRELHEELQGKYGIEKIDVKVIRNIKQGMDYSLLQDLIDMGIYDDRELAESISRLHKGGIVELVRTDDIHDIAFVLTRRGNELWERIRAEYDHANDVLFKGMTEEQVATYKRLSQMVISNINKEVIKRD